MSVVEALGWRARKAFITGVTAGVGADVCRCQGNRARSTPTMRITIGRSRRDLDQGYTKLHPPTVVAGPVRGRHPARQGACSSHLPEPCSPDADLPGCCSPDADLPGCSTAACPSSEGEATSGQP